MYKECTACTSARRKRQHLIRTRKPTRASWRVNSQPVWKLTGDSHRSSPCESHAAQPMEASPSPATSLLAHVWSIMRWLRRSCQGWRRRLLRAGHMQQWYSTSYGIGSPSMHHWPDEEHPSFAWRSSWPESSVFYCYPLWISARPVSLQLPSYLSTLYSPSLRPQRVAGHVGARLFIYIYINTYTSC